MSLCSVSLGGFDVIQPSAAEVGPPINFFRFRTGASNVGEGRFRMLRSDASQILNESEGGPSAAVLVMEDEAGRKIAIPVYVRAEFMESSNQSAANTLLGPENGPNDVVDVSVMDTRSQLFQPVNLAVNQMVQDFPVAGVAPNAAPLFYLQTFNPNAGNPILWTWATLMAQLGFPAIPNAPAWNPRNLRWRGVASARVMDDIASRLYLIVGFDPNDGIAAPAFYAPGSFAAGNMDLLNKATDTRESGGLATRADFAPPGVFDVSFAVADNDASPYQDSQGTYTKSVTLRAGGATQAMHVGGYLALLKNQGGVNGVFVNQTEIDAVAEDIAPRALAFMNNMIAQYVFAGLWSFTVDGVIREVTWISDKDGARTIIQLDNNVDWVPLSDEGKTLFPLANQLITPLGTGGDDVSPGGTRQTWTTSNEFWARITAYAPLPEAIPKPRYKYSFEEVARVGNDYSTVTGGRTGDCTCTLGECDGDPKTLTNFCRYALSMYEGDNLQAAPVSPTQVNAIVRMFLDYDSQGYPQYTFLHSPVRKAGKIVAAGACSGADYTDERYHVQIEDVVAAAVDAQITLQATPDVNNTCSGGPCPAAAPNIVTATNLKELTAHTHLLSVGNVVLLDGIYDLNGDLHYVFEEAPAQVPISVATYCPATNSFTFDCAGATPVLAAAFTPSLYGWLIDDYTLIQQKTAGVACKTSNLFWVNKYNTFIHYDYGMSADVSYPDTKIIRLKDPASDGHPPVTSTPVYPPAAGDVNEFPVYWFPETDSEKDPASCLAGGGLTRNGVKVAGWVYQSKAIGYVGGLFVVDLTQTDGSDGSATTAPTYVYQATDLNGNNIGSGADGPSCRSGGKGSFEAAGGGLGYWAGPGNTNFVLYSACEIENTVACE